MTRQCCSSCSGCAYLSLCLPKLLSSCNNCYCKWTKGAEDSQSHVFRVFSTTALYLKLGRETNTVVKKIGMLLAWAQATVITRRAYSVMLHHVCYIRHFAQYCTNQCTISKRESSTLNVIVHVCSSGLYCTPLLVQACESRV